MEWGGHSKPPKQKKRKNNERFPTLIQFALYSFCRSPRNSRDLRLPGGRDNTRDTSKDSINTSFIIFPYFYVIFISSLFPSAASPKGETRWPNWSGWETGRSLTTGMHWKHIFPMLKCQILKCTKCPSRKCPKPNCPNIKCSTPKRPNTKCPMLNWLNLKCPLFNPPATPPPAARAATCTTSRQSLPTTGHTSSAGRRTTTSQRAKQSQQR